MPKKRRKAKVEWNWGEEQQEAFEKIVELLTTPPVLAYADYTKPFLLHTDASLEGLGAVLYQEQEGKERVIAYASRSLKKSEKNYPCHKLEFLALKWAVVDKFHDYLYGHEFTVKTDNNPLTYVLTTAKLDATGHRWLSALTTYNFKIKYRSGVENRDADILSRYPRREQGREISKDVLQAIYDWYCNENDSTNGRSPLVECVCMNQAVVLNQDAKIPGMEPLVGDKPSLAAAQQRDQMIARVRELLTAGRKLNKRQIKHEQKEVRRMLRDWDKLKIEDEILYRCY